MDHIQYAKDVVTRTSSTALGQTYARIAAEQIPPPLPALEQALSRLSGAAKRAAAINDAMTSTADRLFGSNPEACEAATPPKRDGRFGVLSELLDALERNLSRLDETQRRLGRI